MRTTFRSMALVTLFVAVCSIGISAQAGEGIKVHGGWTIEVHNPDGTLAARHDFQNALNAEGQNVLTALLGGDRTVTRGSWSVYLVAFLISSPCSGRGGCLLYEDAGALQSDGSVAVTTIGSSVRLRGSATANQDGQFTRVSTSQLIGGGIAGFSDRAFASPISVVAGQVVTVTVTFTFS
jgi:hypothetical protein